MTEIMFGQWQLLNNKFAYSKQLSYFYGHMSNGGVKLCQSIKRILNTN